ncbi:MAG: DUF853 domain-containing protein, partial [Firmicutes bacterium]|nr:DUF853 domain-containing protein [Bacillota bacterium]
KAALAESQAKVAAEKAAAEKAAAEKAAAAAADFAAKKETLASNVETKVEEEKKGFLSGLFGKKKS